MKRGFWRPLYIMDQSILAPVLFSTPSYCIPVTHNHLTKTKQTNIKTKLFLFSLHHLYSKDRQGTLCSHVQNDGVLFVCMFKSTGYYLSACTKQWGTICPPMQKRRGTFSPGNYLSVTLCSHLAAIINLAQNLLLDPLVPTLCRMVL